MTNIIPPDNVSAGSTGHVQAHQDISDVLTAHQSQLNALPVTYWGIATLVSGSVAVSQPAVDANSVVLVSRLTPSGVLGRLSVPTVSPGSGFTITSDSASENSTVSWLVLG